MGKFFALTLAVSTTLLSGQIAAADGEAVFKTCQACHTTTSGEAKKFGPHLSKVVGRACGKVEGYEYSKGYMKACNASQIAWSEEEILNYLDNPTKYLKSKGGGRSKMSFMLKDETKRKAVLEYLKTL